MLNFNEPVLQAAFERNVFIVESQVTPLYSCLTIDSIEPFHLDAFCPPRVSIEARKYLTSSKVYLHSITVNEQACWIIMNSNGDLLFKDLYSSCEMLTNDFEKVIDCLADKHRENIALEDAQLGFHYYSA